MLYYIPIIRLFWKCDYSYETSVDAWLARSIRFKQS